MPKANEPRSVWVPPPRNVYQLKISLRCIEPPIWRRILVPDNLTLGDLHYILYPAMGWAGHHMHSFRFGGGFKQTEYAGSQTVEDCGPSILHEDAVMLAQLLKRKGQVFSYEYDYGDSWLHAIKVEKIIPYEAGTILPVCLAGSRACPPEDCGGVPGYDRLLRVLAKATTPDEKEFRERVGKYDPEPFGLEAVNRRIMPRKKGKRS